MPPAVAMGVGAAVSGIGSIVSARSAQPKNVPVPPPNALFPWLNSSFTNSMGSAGPQGIQTLQGFAKDGGGMTPVGDVFQTMVQAQQRMQSQGRGNILEAMGSSGNRYGSGTPQGLADYESQSTKDFSSQLAQLVFQSSESAKGRQFSAASSLADMFGNAGMAFTPSSNMVTGTPSALGSGLSSVGSSINTFALLKAAKMI